jgi:DNA-binding PadR family transcriptional regulator
MNVSVAPPAMESPTRRQRIIPQRRIYESFFHGMLRLFILRQAAREPVYGGALAKLFRQYGYEISPGSLYPLLHSLEHEKLVRRRSRIVRGRERKYYELTALGRACLETVRGNLAALVRGVLFDDGVHPTEH